MRGGFPAALLRPLAALLLRPLAALLLGLLGLAGAAAIPRFSHVFLFILENRGYRQVIGNPQFPELNRLASHYDLATRFYAATHPSLPNYVALIAGRTFGSHSDNPSQRFFGPNLLSQMSAAGLSWKSYQQSLPNPGFRGDYAGRTAIVYAKKHDPAMLFPAIAGSALAEQVVPLHQLGKDLSRGQVPKLSLIIPDVCHDLHGAPSCPAGPRLNRSGDRFIAHWVAAIRRSKAWTGHALIVITFDEGLVSRRTPPSPSAGGGRIATILIVRGGRRPLRSGLLYTPYSLLRTLELSFGLPLLGHARGARSLKAFWGGS
jgi:phospholipase C